jgi:hypothetical protein
METIKQKYQQKLQLEKDKILSENSRLLEESGDIDYQIRLFKTDLFDTQYEQKRAELERDMKLQLKAVEAELRKKVDRERERAAAEVDARIINDREKELRKYKVEISRLQDRKDDLQKQAQVRLKEERRALERTLQEASRQRRLQDDMDVDRERDAARERVQQESDLKLAKIEKDIARVREEGKRALDRYEEEVRRRVELQQEEVYREHQEEFEKEK